jgi:hypothetical protein
MIIKIALCRLSLLSSTLYSLLPLIIPFLEQGVYEFPTGSSGSCNGDGYCYALSATAPVECSIG